MTNPTTPERLTRPPVSVVTGGAGFIGSHVVDRLIANGHNVIVLDDLSGGKKENINPRAEFCQYSVADVALVESVFNRHRVDYVFHLAAYAAEGLSHFIRHFNYTNNVLGSVNLINAAIRYECKCFVFASSIAVYGSAQTPMHEDTRPHPEDPYGIAKYAVELDLEAARNMFGLQYIVFRPHNVYGQRQNIGDPYRNVIGIFMSQILRGMPCTIFGDGTQTRAFTHADDVAPVIARSVDFHQAYGKIINVGSNIAFSLNELANLVQKAMGTDTGVTHLNPRSEVRHAVSDHTRCEELFGHHPNVQLEHGLSRMAQWVRRVPVPEPTPFGDIEIERELPASWKALQLQTRP